MPKEKPLVKIIGILSVTGFSGMGVTLMYAFTSSKPMISLLIGSAYAGLVGYYLALLQTKQTKKDQEVE